MKRTRSGLVLSMVCVLAFAFVMSCASSPTYETNFNEAVFRNTATERAKAAPKRLGTECSIVLDPELASNVYETQEPGASVPGVLAGRGLDIMVPIMMPLYVFEGETILNQLPQDGSGYGVKFGIQEYTATEEVEAKRTIVTNIVLSAEVFDPAGSSIALVTGSGEGRRNAVMRVYAAAELSCAYALANALNDLGMNLTTKHPELAFLIH